MSLGQYERVVDEAIQSQQLNPNSAPTYVNWAFALLRLNRFDEAKAVLEQALARKLDNPIYHRGLFWIAFFQGDREAMKQQIDWYKGKPGEYEGLALQAQFAAFSGQLRAARDFSRRAINAAQGRNFNEIASTYATESAVREALLGNCQQSKERVADAFSNARSKFSKQACAEALALCGEKLQAQKLIDELINQYPKDTLLRTTRTPMIKAAIELHSDNAARAVELLETTREYELGVAACSWPIYLRGLAYLRQRAGMEAVFEFQKMVDHNALIATYPSYALFYPLARLGLARAAKLTGDTAKSRAAYEEFFALWRDADPDIPIFMEAKREYASLR
jgi:tetratricopeptide (TPR) repeat protein